MKIACNREKLLAAFQMAATVVPGRSPKPVLQNVKMEATTDSVTLIATDMEVGIRIDVPDQDGRGTGQRPVVGFAIWFHLAGEHRRDLAD